MGALQLASVIASCAPAVGGAALNATGAGGLFCRRLGEAILRGEIALKAQSQ
jgi:hypothetical protein